jgi:hypothetical protein
MSKSASVDTYVHPEGELGTAHFDFKVAHKGANPAPFAAAPSSGSRCRTVATASAPDANLSVPAL